MKLFGILLIAAGGLLLFFGAVVGFETGFGHLRVMNLPMVIMGGVGLLSGVILYAASSMVTGNFQLTNSAMPLIESNIAYDRNKWSALVKYDDEIALIADKLKPLGQRWVDEFASSYLSLNDKSYLPNLVQKIIAAAKKEDEVFSLERQRNAAEDLAQKERFRKASEHSSAEGRKSWFIQHIASLCVGVMCVFAIIAFFWFYGSEKILKADGPAAIPPDSRPNDQRQYELLASDLLQKLSAIRIRMKVLAIDDKTLTLIQRVDQRNALYNQSKLLIEQAPQITTLSGWSCILDEVSREGDWVIARCSNGKVFYRLQFGSHEQQYSYDKLIIRNKGARIVFSGEIKKNSFSETSDNNVVELFATIDASK